jgi:hypothetical protein
LAARSQTNAQAQSIRFELADERVRFRSRNYWRFPMKGKALALGVLLTAVPLFAHHGGTSLYDISKQITVDATVTEFTWTNPHVEIGLDAKDDKGNVKHWLLEASSPPVMVSRGWNRKSLQTGDVVKVTFNPATRGANVGRLIKLIKANGEELGRVLAQ